jgi:mannose-6-phosphate isomerase-like protein (cupin superfamily)
MTLTLKCLPLAAGLAALAAAPAAAQQAAPAPAAAPAVAPAPRPEPPAEPRDKGVYITLEDMKAIADGVVDKTTGKPGAFSKRLINHSTHSTAFIRLTKPDTPHAHGTWSEVFVVREGSGVLETGGTITGVTGHNSGTHGDIFLNPASRRTAEETQRQPGAPGDLAGTDVEGGYRQHVKAGDIILVPAGVSHRWVQVDGSVTYLDIKFPKAR